LTPPFGIAPEGDLDADKGEVRSMELRLIWTTYPGNLTAVRPEE